MSGPLINIFFTGLIVLVPDASSNSLTAYLVDDKMPDVPCNHEARFVVHGDAAITQETKKLCIVSEGPKKITCNLLSDTKIVLKTENGTSLLPRRPPGPSGTPIYMPTNKTQGDGGSPGWLLRLANVSSEAATSRPASEAMQLSDAEFSFGWNQAFTCEFDEGGVGKVHPMTFIGSHWNGLFSWNLPISGIFQ